MDRAFVFGLGVFVAVLGGLFSIVYAIAYQNSIAAALATLCIGYLAGLLAVFVLNR